MTEVIGLRSKMYSYTGEACEASIGLNQLDQLGGFLENLSVDEDIVTGANGQELQSLGKIDTTLQLDQTL